MAANKALRRLLARIESLKKRVVSLEGDIEQAEEDRYAAETRSRYRQKAACKEKRQLRADLDEQRRQEDYTRYERERLVKEIERASAWVDSYGVEMGIRKLKSL